MSQLLDGTDSLTLVAETPSKRRPPWGEARTLRVLFPCQVRRNADLTYTARCRELGIVGDDLPSEEAALEHLRSLIRIASVGYAKQRVGS